MSALTLADRVLALEGALRDVPHAFGGALALAYHAEPRATIDVDLNVFVPPSEFDVVAGPLRDLGVAVDAVGARAVVERDGQVRVLWDHTPIDLFFAYDDFHAAAAGATQRVPFREGTIPILSAEHLLVCKVVFDRAKDWVDIDAVLADTAVDPAEVLRWVARIAGDDDPRFGRVAAVLTRR